MPWQLLVWLVAFIMQSGALGMCIYQLVQLTDLEADFINPHEAAKNYNLVAVSFNLLYLGDTLVFLVASPHALLPRFRVTQLPDIAAQAAGTVLLLLTGNWIVGTLQLAALAYNVLQHRGGRHLVDVTEIFRQIKPRRKILLIKLGMYLLVFVGIIYRFIETLVHGLISPSGHAAARSILREAAASLHR
jgi:hypothetical protein